MVYNQNLFMGLQWAEYEVYVALGDGVVFSLDYKMFQGVTPLKDTYIIHTHAREVKRKVVKRMSRRISKFKTAVYNFKIWSVIIDFDDCSV